MSYEHIVLLKLQATPTAGKRKIILRNHRRFLERQQRLAAEQLAAQRELKLQAKERLRLEAEELFSRVKVINWLNFYCSTEVDDPNEGDSLKLKLEALRVRPPPIVHEDIIQALETPVDPQPAAIDLTLPNVEIIDLSKNEEYDPEDPDDPKFIDDPVKIEKARKRVLEKKKSKIVNELKLAGKKIVINKKHRLKNLIKDLSKNINNQKDKEFHENIIIYKSNFNKKDFI